MGPHAWWIQVGAVVLALNAVGIAHLFLVAWRMRVYTSLVAGPVRRRWRIALTSLLVAVFVLVATWVLDLSIELSVRELRLGTLVSVIFLFAPYCWYFDRYPFWYPLQRIDTSQMGNWVGRAGRVVLRATLGGILLIVIGQTIELLT